MLGVDEVLGPFVIQLAYGRGAKFAIFPYFSQLHNHSTGFRCGVYAHVFLRPPSLTLWTASRRRASNSFAVPLLLIAASIGSASTVGQGCFPAGQ